MSELPDGWASATLGEVADLSSGFGFPKKFQGKATGELPFAKVRDISFAVKNTASLLSQAGHWVDGEDLIAMKARPVPAGSVVFAKIGEAVRLNRRAILNQATVIDNNCMALSPTEAIGDPRFLLQFMQTVDLSPFAVATTVPSVRRGDVDSIALDLPPLPEQRRIVAKLDRLSARSAAARDHLAHTTTLSTRAKQAILKSAFEGLITEEWRAAQSLEELSTDLEGIDGRVPHLGDIPDTWGWRAVGFVSKVSGGLTKNRARADMPLKAPYLRVANVYANELRLNEVAEIGCTEADIARTLVEAGDLLVVEGNGSQDQIGRVAMWSGEVDGCLHQNHLIRVRPGPWVSSKFLLYWMLSPNGRTAIEAVASSSSGLHTLSLSKVKGMPIPLCSKAEQSKIVRRIEAAFARIDRLTEEATRAAHLVDRLDERLLSKAFAGELLPQDPNDEPAEALLARIREARAAAPKPTRGRKKKAAAE